jgi:RND family efflux transporter MFP subunit
MFKNKSFIPWLIATVAVIAVIVVMLGRAKPSVAASADTATVTTVTLAESVEASGYIQAQQYASLVWKTGGTVATIPVSVGDKVEAGDVLMSLQTTSASANVISAQADLLNTQKQLDALRNPDGKIRADAQKALANAYTAWNDARNRLSNALSGKQSSGDDKKYDDITNAEGDLNDSLNAFALTASPHAQWYYWAGRMESLNRKGDYDFAALAASLRNSLDSDDADFVDDIVDAQNKYEQAVTDFSESITDYATASELNAAAATYQQSAEVLMNASQNAYETLVAPNPRDLASAQAKVDAAQATIDSLSIIAPFDGEVLAIEQHPGDLVSTGTVAISLANRSNLYIDTQVDEADIAQVAVGNPATITMDAIPGVTLNGTVTFIKPVSEMVSGLVKYRVHIELAPLEETMEDPVLLGATADVTIQVSDAQAALAVPASAVQSDNAGEFVMLIKTDGSTQRVTVQSGESVDNLVIVSGDLQEGDKVQSKYQNGIQPAVRGLK